MSTASIRGQMWLSQRRLRELLHIGGHLCAEGCHLLLELNYGGVKGLVIGSEVGYFLFEWCDFALREIGKILLHSIKYVLFQVS